MFQEQKALFLYCVSPVHMGAGTALGVIDNPIQRERHTGHPVVAGSGLKGALRHHLGQTWDDKTLCAVFGPETSASSDHAGAVSLSDAQLVAFPVRSAKRAFVYATSPTALSRAARLLDAARVKCDWQITDVEANHCRFANANPNSILTGNKIALESFEFTAHLDKPLRTISEWLAENALPRGKAYQFFRDKLKDDLVLLSDEDFGYFVKNATMVEPHVRIDDITGTASDGGLFYTENLPPESIMLSLVMASKDRRKNGASLDAAQVMQTLVAGNGQQPGINNLLLQIGGDATTGRGQVILTVAGGN